METTSRSEPETAPTDDGRKVDGYLLAAFPWYGLDEAYTGPRWLMRVGAAADGTVEHGATGHGEEPTIRVETAKETHRFAVVVTVASRPVRPSADDTGFLEATSVSTAAWLAGAGLLAHTWPSQMDRSLRQDWLDQQTMIAWELADELDGEGWSELILPVDGAPTAFRYRESEYGWVLAGSADGDPEGVHIGAYGRGMSAYGLAFSIVKDLAAYEG
ncbi:MULTISPECIES: hypothetical protein [Streptomyces]|uniref:Uncharacterized protein n=2 Tax=Streptomyces TaxID=1883 RepID=A0A4Q9HXE2_STRKA|nr:MULTISPECIES: hypothetical protein [Streptomyces]MYU52086.1 hypothetical protein [Streptomyces sp. SID7805]TBO59655.1 hypothetical protein EYS09_10995 [Streptomyces kasugaensis]WSK14914.1 hypothetical protein OG717_26075 [Streptomyces celluloflavus]